MKRAPSANLPLYRFLKKTAGRAFLKAYPVQLTNPEVMKTMKGPCLILPNHIMKWDAVLLGALLPEALHFMGSESHFRKPWIGWFLSQIGIFPKAKAKSDLGAIRHMMDLKSKGKVICVFPEGQMSWDGSGLPLFYSTAKLIKLLKIPVYIPLYSGGSAVYPRWGKSTRKGPIELTIHALFEDPAEFRKMDTDSIYDKMKSIIQYQDIDKTIPEKNWHYQSRRRAEYLENILFICPSCKGLASLYSDGNHFTCRECSYSVEMDDQYHFHTEQDGIPRLKTPMEWNLWQKNIIPLILKDYEDEKSNRPLIVDEAVCIKTGHRMEALKTWTKKGEMALFRDHIMLRPEKGDMRLIPFSEMNAVHVMTRQKLEFYHDKTLYAFFFPSLRVSGYKWLCLLRSLGVPSSYAWPGEDVEKI